MEGIDYQFVRSEEAVPSPTSCELIEVTTALACAASDPALAVQIKTGVGRFFADLTKAPYKTLFNPSVSGATAFNAVVVQRSIDEWIDTKKKQLPKKSGPQWGALVHGNRILAALAFQQYGGKLAQPIEAFAKGFNLPELHLILTTAHTKAVDAIKQHYEGRHLAVLFKNPTMSKHVFDVAAS